MENCFAELWDVLGKAAVITTAGVFVRKPEMPGKGRGFHSDGVFWDGMSLGTRDLVKNPGMSLSMEAVTRKHFETVLDRFCDPAHKDHLVLAGLRTYSFREAEPEIWSE